jgi:diacylglycerol kinase family enzyme
MGAVLIVNPFASGVTGPRLEAVRDVLRRGGPVETLLTECGGHATELAASAAADRLYVFGGDGVFNEVLNGVGDIPVGFIPGGGTSVLPRALGLPRDPVGAAERLLDGRTRRISLGRVNGRRFGFSAGIGLDAELVRRLDALGRTHEGRRPGDLAFIAIAVRTLAGRRVRFEPVLEVRGLGRAALALVANGDPYTYAGSLAVHVAPLARFELGLDVVAPRRIRPGSIPRFLRYIVSGRGQERDPDIVYGHDLDRVEVVCDAPLPLQADGEDLGDVTEAVFEAERAALDVLV